MELELVAQAETGRKALESIRELRARRGGAGREDAGFRWPRGNAGRHAREPSDEGSCFCRPSCRARPSTVRSRGAPRATSPRTATPTRYVTPSSPSHAGSTVLGPEIQQGIGEEIRLRAPAGPSPLSEREREILSMTAAGHTAADIGRRLYLSPATVKTHLQRIYQKLGVSDRAAAVAAAIARGCWSRSPGPGCLRSPYEASDSAASRPVL